MVLDKMMKLGYIKKYQDDVELLEDVIVENKQAIEMCNIYRDILSGTMDAFASVISNNLNIVMKLMTSITIIISIPTPVSYTHLDGATLIIVDVPRVEAEGSSFVYSTIPVSYTHLWRWIPIADNCLPSHAQLCLAGWGGNYQQWESSAIGSFGESFCYDPETAHGRAFIDDIRPLLVYKLNSPEKPRYNCCLLYTSRCV